MSLVTAPQCLKSCFHLYALLPNTLALTWFIQDSQVVVISGGYLHVKVVEVKFYATDLFVLKQEKFAVISNFLVFNF